MSTASPANGLADIRRAAPAALGAWYEKRHGKL